ncbi:MAG: putative DNA binding domain-containing protein, partial [Bacteroidales bacterium]|nr:putative DNA binding domain-containing protein [Bacteroidales bacterium]
MENLREKIRAAIKRSEHQEIEFKSAKGGLPESFWETFSAFANTNGGIIVLGVKEKNGQFYPDGLTDEQITSYKKKFWDCAHNKEKVSTPLLMEKEVHSENIEDQKVLVFEIPRAHFSLRPVYLTPNPLGHTFRRNHEGDYRCTDLEVRQMFADSMHVNQPFDNEILPGFTLDDLDMPTLRGFRNRFEARKPDHPWISYSDMDFLEKIGAYRCDRSTGKEGFTRAGILMFGKTESINDPACAPWYFPDYQEKMSINPNERWSDRLYPDGTWEANLYQFFYKTYNKISHTLPMPFKLDGITRVEETSAHVSLREALVNLCVHSSYGEQGNMVVKRELDKITFRNPGRMLVSPEDFYAGGHSECRNPVIQKMFTLLGYGEKAGSGYDYISKGWTDNNWPKPQISEHSTPDYVLLEFDVEALINIMNQDLENQGQQGESQRDQDSQRRDHQNGQRDQDSQ